jgi:hypothetical protein
MEISIDTFFRSISIDTVKIVLELFDEERWVIHLYSNTPPHVQAPQGRIHGYCSEL